MLASVDCFYELSLQAAESAILHWRWWRNVSDVTGFEWVLAGAPWFWKWNEEMGFFFVEVRLDESLNVLGFRKLLLFFTPSVLLFYFSNNFHELFGNLGASSLRTRRCRNLSTLLGIGNYFIIFLTILKCRSRRIKLKL